jgi:hypothetical protein
MSDHRVVDARSFAFDRALAARLRDEPALIEKARENLDRWLLSCSPAVRPALEEWREILDGPRSELFDLLGGTDERAVRLRQSTPFAGILSAAERTEILLQFHEPRTA